MHSHYEFGPERWTNSLKKLNIYPKEVLDIGANVGQFYQSFKSVFPDSNILSIEGNPNCQRELLTINPNSIITLLGKEEGQTIFYVNKNFDKCPGASIKKENTIFYDNCLQHTFPVKTLDSLNKKFDYIKIDVQGAELDIIKGGLNTILGCDILQLELSILKYNKNAPLIGEIISYLHNLDFRVYEIASLCYWNHRLNQSDFIFINSRKLENLLDI